MCSRSFLKGISISHAHWGATRVSSHIGKSYLRYMKFIHNCCRAWQFWCESSLCHFCTCACVLWLSMVLTLTSTWRHVLQLIHWCITLCERHLQNNVLCGSHVSGALVKTCGYQNQFDGLNQLNLHMYHVVSLCGPWFASWMKMLVTQGSTTISGFNLLADNVKLMSGLLL